jgi:hypothetical protein
MTENDPVLTPEERKLVDQLSEKDIEEIDQALLGNASQHWRKVAMVVGATMIDLKNKVAGIPDVYYSQRVMHLVRIGLLDFEGDQRRMRFSEVRLATK